MRERDVQIGRNVKALRGDRTQQWVVDAMRERGHVKWSQATMWAVEKGDRPLRLAEAEDLAFVLGVRQLWMLAMTETEVKLFGKTRAVDGALNVLFDGIETYAKAHTELLEALDGLDKADTPRLQNAVSMAKLDVATVLRDLLKRAEEISRG